jgi:hypothetical protein
MWEEFHDPGLAICVPTAPLQIILRLPYSQPPCDKRSSSETTRRKRNRQRMEEVTVSLLILLRLLRHFGINGPSTGPTLRHQQQLGLPSPPKRTTFTDSRLPSKLPSAFCPRYGHFYSVDSMPEELFTCLAVRSTLVFPKVPLREVWSLLREFLSSEKAETVLLSLSMRSPARRTQSTYSYRSVSTLSRIYRIAMPLR